MNRPSLFLAFGDKQSLYRKVLDRYAGGPSSYLREAMSAPTARETVERMLFGAIDLVTSPDNPSICMIAQGTLVCGEEGEDVRQELIARRRMGERLLRERIARAVAEGELPDDADAASLALYFVTVMRGLGISALTGASRDDLQATARMALSVWPERPA